MVEDGINLRPYGDAPLARNHGQLFLYDDPGSAAARAEVKLRAYLDGAREDAPAGKAVRWLVALSVIGGSIVLFPAVIGILGANLCLVALGVGGGVCCVAAGIRAWVDSSVNTPEGCVAEFCRAVNRSDFSRAYSLVAPVDKDSYARPAITEDEQNPADVKRYCFDSFDEFKRYWAKLRGLSPSARLMLVPGAGFNYVTPDIAVVDLNLDIQRSMRLAKATPATSIRRIVLRYGNEWRLFNGDALPSDEVDKQWLDRLLAEARKDRAE